MSECKVLYENDVPEIKVMPEAMYKMRYFIDKTDKEIGWLGYVNKVSDTLYIIEDVVLLKQQVHSATTEIDPGAIAELVTELNQTEEGKIKYNKLKMWGHSHVNMSTSASGQDDSQMDDFANDTFFIRLIGNKRGEWNVCLYDYEHNVLWSELSLGYYYEVNIDDAALDAEIKEKVSEITYKSNKVPSYWDRYTNDNYYKWGKDAYTPSSYKDYWGMQEEKAQEKEKIDTPYPINGEPTKEDIRNIKRFIASDEGECYYAATGTLTELSNTIYDYYGCELDMKTLSELRNDLVIIWSSKYGGRYNG